MPEGAGVCSQLGLVMWHQVWLVRVRRHYVVTLAQLAVMLLVLCSVWDESVAPFRAGPHKDYFFDSADAVEFWGRPNESWTNGELAFAPDEAFFADLVQKVCDSLKGTWKPVPFKNRSMAVEYTEKTPASGSDLQSRRVAVWFDRPADDRLTYQVRIRDARFDRHDDYLRGLLVPGPFDTDRFDEMRLLLPIQYFIESLFIEAIKNSSKRLAQMKVELMRFPYPRLFYGSEDRTLSRVALRFAVGFFVPFCFLVVKLVHEKRTGRKDMLRRAGLTDVSYWMGYFFEMGFVIGCAILLMYVPLFLYPNSSGTAFLEYVDAGLFVTLLAVFGVLTIMHAMLLSIFLWELLQNPFGYGYYLTRRSAKLASTLSPIMYLHWCLRAIERFEKYELSLTWKNSFDSGATLDNVNVGELSMLALSTMLILAGLIWYLDNVVPWGYGVPKPFYFICSPEYWSPYRKWDIRVVSTGLDPLYFERHEARKVEPVIHFVDLTAAGRNSVDVKNVNLTIFNRQITVILGPQNCGSSTMLDVVIGMNCPTSGVAYVCNFDASSSSGRAWEYFSACPDEGALFDDLTVEEHLLFFASLRLQSSNEVEAAVSWVLPQLNLEPFRDSLVSDLPQRLRKALCVAITICGIKETPLLIFVEPTKLMDPKNRHEVWEVLARVSRRSAVLVATQSIEEAEVLADRLIIMRDGRVVCAGSPTWLKTQFDSGYFLRFTKLPNFRGNDVKRVVQYHMGQGEPTRNTKVEMVFNLSDAREYTNRMAAMLHYLGKRRSLLGIASMSLTSCTLEDIYIRMVTGTQGDASAALIAPQTSLSDARNKLELDAVKKLCTSSATDAGRCAVLVALLRKRTLIWMRVWWTKPLTVGIPALFLILLAFCERQLLPALSLERDTLTYVPETFFDKVYSFIEATNASKKFTDNVLLPLMNEHSVTVFSVTNAFVERELLFWAQENIYEYIYHYQMGISVLGERVFLWYNGQCPHSASLVVNMFHTAVLRNLTGKKGSGITLINSAFANSSLDSRIEFERINGRLSLRADQPRLGHEMEVFAIRNVFTRILYAFFLSAAMSLYMAGHVFAPLVEGNSGLKHVQLMTGMSGCLYWTGHLLFDFVMACWASIFFVCMIFLSNTDMGPDYHMGILLLFLANAFSSLPLTYLVSLTFRSPTSAFCLFSFVLFVAGIMGSAGVEILKMLMLENPLTTYSVIFFIWGFVFRWFPTYSLVRGIAKVKLLFKYNAICRAGGELLAEACRDPNFANDDRVSRCCQARQENVTARLLLPLEPFYETGFYEAVSMMVEGLLYVAVLSFVDSPLAYTVRAYIARCLHGTSDEDEAAVEKGPRLVATSLDPEVEREVKLVNQVCQTRAFKDVAMAIRNLQKTVGLLTKVKIVDGASILLNQGECLGLVGVNGSGKTTLLEILVGLVVPTGGGAYTSALSLGGNLRSWQQSIGYAPDGISEQSLPPLTVGEYLDMVASLRGVTARRLAIASALTLMSGRLKVDKRIDTCSHGELKMLLISSAAIGVPPILLVDEPYSDVEPLYRNDIIRMLQVLKGSQAMSIIMTSHRMSHCEVLCDRVAVIEDGKIEALGDALQMNQKYGRSYVVSIRLPLERRFDYVLQYHIGESMQEAFHQCTFCYNYKGVMNFTVGTTYTSWSELFGKMTTIQRDHELPEFSVGDITLEHIFVGLARRQILFAGVRPHSYLSGAPSQAASGAPTRAVSGAPTRAASGAPTRAASVAASRAASVAASRAASVAASRAASRARSPPTY